MRKRVIIVMLMEFSLSHIATIDDMILPIAVDSEIRASGAILVN